LRKKGARKQNAGCDALVAACCWRPLFVNNPVVDDPFRLLYIERLFLLWAPELSDAMIHGSGVGSAAPNSTNNDPFLFSGQCANGHPRSFCLEVFFG
jgi:hypothetical protein